MLCRLKGSFHTLAVTSALSPRQPVQTSHFSPCSVALEPLLSHRGVTATSQMASRWLLCWPTNGPLHLVDVTFTEFLSTPKLASSPQFHQFNVSFTNSYGTPWASLSSSRLNNVTFTFNKNATHICIQGVPKNVLLAQNLNQHWVLWG